MNNMKIAEVIISSQVKSLDKTYHYLTDLDLLEGTRSGSLWEGKPQNHRLLYGICRPFRISGFKANYKSG